jgi:hypothetical protein
MDFTGVIAKINAFFNIFTEISRFFEAEKYPFSGKISYEHVAHYRSPERGEILRKSR